MSKTLVPVFANLLCLSTQEAVAPVRKPDFFNDSPRSTAKQKERHAWSVDSTSGVQVSSLSAKRWVLFFWPEFEVQFFAGPLCSNAHAALAQVGTTELFTDTRNSVAGPQNGRGWTDGSILGVQVSSASLQISNHQFSAN